jgi:hypothetical protein
MLDNPFSYTTREAARALNVSVEAVRAQYRRTGAFRGIVPTKLPNGRLLWPRAEVLRLAGTPAAGPRAVIDLRATNPWLEELGLPTDDPMPATTPTSSRRAGSTSGRSARLERGCVPAPTFCKQPHDTRAAHQLAAPEGTCCGPPHCRP